MKMLFFEEDFKNYVFAFTNALKELDSLFLEQLNVITNISTKVVWNKNQYILLKMLNLLVSLVITVLCKLI